MKNEKIERGVYFLANNRVIEQVVAFLRSFRTHNPTIPLCLIPFDSDFDRVAELKDTYSFNIFDDPELLAACDSISEKFHGHVLGTYRKLVAWEGAFEAFAYIDVDTVVIDSIDFAFETLGYGQYIGSHSNIESIRRYVWNDRIYDSNLLTPAQIDYATNTGFFVSLRGLLPMKHVLAKVGAALELKDSMELSCMEQPFLNYLIVTSGYRYTSLLRLKLTGVVPDAKLEWWGGSTGGNVDGGKLYPPFAGKIFLVHWAGVWKEIAASGKKLPYHELWSFYRRADIPADIFRSSLFAKKSLIKSAHRELVVRMSLIRGRINFRKTNKSVFP